MQICTSSHNYHQSLQHSQAQILKPGEAERDRREQIYRLDVRGHTTGLNPVLQGSPSHPRPLESRYLRSHLTILPSAGLKWCVIPPPTPRASNSTAPGKNVGACRRINKYLLFNQQYFDWRCKHGLMPGKPEPSWPALPANFFLYLVGRL